MFLESTKYKLSSVQVNLPKHLASTIIKWGEDHIDDDKIFEEPGCGREDEIHITVLYGITSNKPDDVRTACRKFSPFTVELGETSLFVENPKFDVLKIEVKSHRLHEINKHLRNKVDYISKYPEYKPHVTIAYIQKGKGWKLQGNDQFKGKLFEVNTLLFSDQDATKTVIPLS